MTLQGPAMHGMFDHLYPHMARWVQAHGSIKIGYDDYSRSFARAMDIGGMIWEGLEHSQPWMRPCKPWKVP